MTTLLQCGHTANATTEDGAPCCVICYGIHPGADQVAEQPADLAGRQARCTCGRTRPSTDAPRLAFFRHRPDRQTDEYYCGHAGWD